MTQRKPPNMSFPDWIERQIQTAQADGAFDNLAGSGKPLRDLDRPWHELSWVANYLHRENIDIAALLPPGLALAKEVELLPQRLLAVRSSSQVREIVEELNDRIRDAHRRPQTGPPIRVRPLSVEDVLSQWRAAREEADAAATAARIAIKADAATKHTPEHPRRTGFWRRRSS